jgi:hypothetical protein
MAEARLLEACGICLEQLHSGDAVKYRLQCGHEFHTDCIICWFRRRNVSSCPICRDDPAPRHAAARTAHTPHAAHAAHAAHASSSDFTSDTETESESGFLESLRPETLHRFLAATLRACSRRDASRRLRALAERYSAARKRFAEAKSALWRHERSSVGRFPELRQASKRLRRTLDSELARYYAAARALFRAAELLP